MTHQRLHGSMPPLSGLGPAILGAVLFTCLALLGTNCGSSSSTSPSLPATPTVTALSVTGPITTASPGQTAQFTATARLSDGTTPDVTASAMWQSSNAAVATVSMAGLVTAVGGGDADIRATYQGQTGAQTVSVVAPPPPIPGIACGIERWSVKTLSDSGASRVNLANVQTTTIRDLNLLTAHCSGLPNPRTFPPEFQVYEVMGRITVVRSEDDRDYHIALADPSDSTYTIVTEIADPACEGASSSPYRQTLSQVRAAFDSLVGGQPLSSLVGTLVRVRGVGFYDFDHGQTGRSQSCVELHAVVSIERVQ